MASFSSDEGDNFEVDRIVDSRKRGRTTEYLVKWKDRDSDDDSWEPTKALRGNQAAIRAYEEGQLTKSASRKRVSQQTKQEESSRTTRGGRSVTRKTTVTTVTKTVSGAQSESSSPENSPVLRRKTFEVQESSSLGDFGKSKSEGSSSSSCVFGMFDCSGLEMPVLILIACIVFITVTFATQQK